MSGLLFKADCIGSKSSHKNTEDEQVRQRERRSIRWSAPVAPDALTLDAGTSDLKGEGPWRRKPRTKPAVTTVDSERRLCTRLDAVQRNRTYSICCPTQFFCDEFERKIEANRAHENQKWIFNLIEGHSAPTERVFQNTKDWILVQGNSYNASEMRYLVIFKDTSLRTIRDLRKVHLPMLRNACQGVQTFLKSNNEKPEDFKMYFHYLPSVFQLHLHVCRSTSGDGIRTQHLACVIRNIERCDTWYRDALILFAPPRMARQAQGNVCVLDDKATDKPGGVYI